MTSRETYCQTDESEESSWESCTCSYIMKYWRDYRVESEADYCLYPVRDHIHLLWDYDYSKSPDGIIADICPATCSAYGVGPCAPPAPPTTPPSPPIPPIAPCADQLPAIMTSREPHCDGSWELCTCE